MQRTYIYLWQTAPGRGGRGYVRLTFGNAGSDTGLMDWHATTSFASQGQVLSLVGNLMLSLGDAGRNAGVKTADAVMKLLAPIAGLPVLGRFEIDQTELRTLRALSGDALETWLERAVQRVRPLDGAGMGR